LVALSQLPPAFVIPEFFQVYLCTTSEMWKMGKIK